MVVVLGVLIGLLIGGVLLDIFGVRLVFYIIGVFFLGSFFFILFFVKEKFILVEKKEMWLGKEVFLLFKNLGLIIFLFIMIMMI